MQQVLIHPPLLHASPNSWIFQPLIFNSALLVLKISVSNVNDMIPSDDALWRHWNRSCWVIDMWKQADKNHTIVKPIIAHGWQIRDGIDWDSSNNIAAVRQRVSLQTKGCKCATGCTTAHCGCKKNQNCSEGCECSNCLNVATTPS